ncbi:MAG: nicotinate-nucleotide diphosphorylase (carboxylating), partial [Candidatus Eisenbacteria bacterium]|nr:nicotinate-nucleotide diphosphorylase (carboxylating) [Candidatus Eisenbacteria bacterium]
AALEVEHLLLDNMSPDEIREIVALLSRKSPRPFLEISGGVTLETIRPYAETGADAVSVGALTHSASVLDLGLDVDQL